jgi:hypothetical protein
MVYSHLSTNCALVKDELFGQAKIPRSVKPFIGPDIVDVVEVDEVRFNFIFVVKDP